MSYRVISCVNKIKKQWSTELPLHMIFEGEQVNNYEDCDFKNIDMNKLYADYDQIEKGYEDYDRQEKSELFARGVQGGQYLAEVLTGRIKRAVLGKLPAGTVVLYNMPWRQNAENPKNKTFEVRPMVKGDLKNYSTPSGKVLLLEITDPGTPSPYDVKIDDPVWKNSLNLTKFCVVRCFEGCLESENFTLPSIDVLGCINNWYSQDLWQNLLAMCKEVPPEIIHIHDSLNICDRKHKLNENNSSHKPIAYVVMRF